MTETLACWIIAAWPILVVVALVGSIGGLGRFHWRK